MAAVFNSKADNITASVLKTARLAALYGSEDSKDLETYTDLFEEIIASKNEALRAKKALDDSKGAVTIEEFQARYDKNIKIELPNIQNSEEYQNLVSGIKQNFQVHNNVGASTRLDEDIIMESEISDIDPITKQRMKNPVRNKNCGHRYEKSSILATINIQPRVRCPVLGCGNKQLIKANDLEPDFEFEQLLQRLRNEEDL